MSCRTFACVIAGYFLIAWPVSAGDGPYFRMVPVQPQGVDAGAYPPGTVIDEEAGTISFPGTGPQRVWLEVRFGGWESLGELETLQFSTVDLPDSTGGLLRKAIEPCTPGAGGNEFCRRKFGEGPEGASGCLSLPNIPPLCYPAFPQFVDGDFRTDYLTDHDIFACQLFGNHLACGQTPFSGQCAIDDHIEKYIATLVVETTKAVTEPTDIPVNFLHHESHTFFIECTNSHPSVVPATTGAVIKFLGAPCKNDDHCDDGNPCTSNFCKDGFCQSTNNSDPCDDGNICTTDSQCDTGACVGTPIDCDDGDLCNGLEWCDTELGCTAGDVWMDAEPQCNGSVSRIRNNEIILWFHEQLTSGVGGLCEVRELLPDGLYGPDLSEDFVFEVTGNALRVREQGSVLDNRKWYGLLCDEGIGAIGPFEYHFTVLMGDANGDHFIDASDLSTCNSLVSPLRYRCDVDAAGSDCGTVHRCDANEDGFVNAIDLSTINAYVGPFAGPLKPKGH
jgi:hypothetical protein